MKILITAGTTHEHIDPVRFISNASSGLQGILLAKVALSNNIGISEPSKVILIIGPTQIKEFGVLENYQHLYPEKLEIIKVTSAEEMYNAAMEHFPNVDVAICSAAVGDYRVKEIATDKIKRNGDSITIELIPNKDIAKELGLIKTDKQLLIGFALETSNGVENAKAKIIKKNFDYIVLNETNAENKAFGTDDNIVKIISKEGEIVEYKQMLKSKIAKEILKLIK